MDGIFANAKWIWHSEGVCVDDHAEFFGTVKYCKVSGDVIFRISCDSDYALYINGKFVTSNQYGDFPHYKIYDEIDVTEFLSDGQNAVKIVVWYFGQTSQKYYPSTAGVIFEFVQGDNQLLYSDHTVSSRRSRTYACGRAKNVSSQLGFSFLYDLIKEDKKDEEKGISPSVIVDKDCTLYIRPNQKLCYGSAVEPYSVSIKHGGRTVLVDLGREVVGLATLKFYSEKSQRITVVFGEKIVSENVPRFLGGNDYSFELIAKAGDNEFFDPFLRLGCRYLQIIAQEEVKVEKLSLIPTYYPVTEKAIPKLSKLDADIYRLCVDTLKLCALEHYVDCPFREQGLYAFDSRNQMLAGYYAFGGRDYFEYAKSNLLLFAFDRREDKLLTITAPSDIKLLIPSFSLHYVIAVNEYLKYSGDTAMDSVVIEKINDIMCVFSSMVENGLVKNILADGYWNFYDWSLGADNCKQEYDIFANCLYLIAVKAYRNICKILSVCPAIHSKEDLVKDQVYARFFDKEKGLFTVSETDRTYTQLGNSLAILSDVVDKKTAVDILEKIIAGKTVSSSLSTKVFFYDALLLTDKERYGKVVIDEIRLNYGRMLDAGATATWETLDGEFAFGGSGSLCHGWSAIPVYYYNIIMNK